MFSFRTTAFQDQPDLVLRQGKIALLTNHTCWHPDSGKYLFEEIYSRGNLKRIFTPEHGLFAELQDQIALDNTDIYEGIGLKGVEIYSLYNSNDPTKEIPLKLLTDLDALVIELQDVGVRYYTYNSTILSLFKTLKNNSINLPIYLIDRINPAGRQVEGTMLEPEFSSFIGIEGITHRHGLTIGEISTLLYNELNAKFPLHIISYIASGNTKYLLPWSIPPSPNFPGLFTSHFYSGQCLWEGTNLSEGRGTTRPFEIFGAPFLEKISKYKEVNMLSTWNDINSPIYDEGVFVRWLKFKPTFHKYAGELCFGFQLHPVPGVQYHALAHNLKIIKFISQNFDEFKWREGAYESGNNKSAIELLVGDKLLLDYLNNKEDWENIKEYMKIEEQKWIRKAKKFMLYDDQLFRVK